MTQQASDDSMIAERPMMVRQRSRSTIACNASASEFWSSEVKSRERNAGPIERLKIKLTSGAFIVRRHILQDRGQGMGPLYRMLAKYAMHVRNPLVSTPSPHAHCLADSIKTSRCRDETEACADLVSRGALFTRHAFLGAARPEAPGLERLWTIPAVRQSSEEIESVMKSQGSWCLMPPSPA